VTVFEKWQNFYVIVGSSAGALIGLQFVVLSFITGMRGTRFNPQSAGAFATPAIVHFAAVLGLSGILCAPWDGTGAVSFLFGLEGAVGVIYVLVVMRRIRKQTAYRPLFEDWLFHVLLPFAAYLILTGSAYTARIHLRESLFVVGGAALLLLFTGIHNAWDAVTYHVFVTAAKQEPGAPE
jgi:hypothetical protein